jgi:hypothetical protein
VLGIFRNVECKIQIYDMPVDSHIMHKVMDEQDLKKKNLLFNAIFV